MKCSCAECGCFPLEEDESVIVGKALLCESCARQYIEDEESEDGN